MKIFFFKTQGTRLGATVAIRKGLQQTCTCLAVISLDSALKKDNNCYPQVILKECKYIEKKVVRHIIDDLESSSDDFDDSDDSDEEQNKDIKLMFLEKAILREQF